MPTDGQFSPGYFALLRAIHSAGGVPCETAPSLFFPEQIPDPVARRAAINAAKQLCKTCPVLDRCFEYAVTSGEEYGIWAGTLPSER